MITREYNIVINTKTTKAINTYASFVQRDVEVNYLNISFLDGDLPLDLTQFSQIQIAFERVDGVIIAGNTIEFIDALNGKARYELGTTEVELVGKVNGIINFYGSHGERLSTCIFYFSVVREIDTDEAIQTSNQYTLLSDLIKQVEELNKANKWYVGSTEPTAGLGNVEDLYLNTANANIYQKNEIGWENIGNLGTGDGGTGLPLGGLEGQVLMKQSDIDGDATWKSITFPEPPKEIPQDGLPGQILSQTDYGLKWIDLPESPKELPEFGQEGQVLTKTVDGVAWQTPEAPIPTITDHNNLNGLQGGAVGEYYHLTFQELNKLNGVKKITVMELEDPNYVGEEGEIILILE